MRPAVDLDALERFGAVEGDLNDIHLVAYHCTRAFRRDIEQVGLRLLRIDAQLSYVRQALADFGLEPKELLLFDEVARRYLVRSQRESREGRIWFCLNRAMFEMDNGCDNFFRYFGGEAVFRAFVGDPECYPIRSALCALGEPLVVTAKIPLAAVAPFQRDQIVEVLLRKKQCLCEAFVSQAIAAQDILSISPRYVDVPEQQSGLR